MKFKLLLILTFIIAFLIGCGNQIEELPEALYLPGTSSTQRPIATAVPSPQPNESDEFDKQPSEEWQTETPLPSETDEPAAGNQLNGHNPTPNIVNSTPTAVPPGMTNPFPTTFLSPYDENGQLSTTRHSWGFVRNNQNQPPPLPGGRWGFDIREFNAIHLGDFSCRNIYLTFDLGYEYRFTPVILDTLKEQDVTAAFFITGGYLRQNPDLVRRMVDEGHIVANHGDRHLSNPALTQTQLTFEIMEVDRLFYDLIGRPMSRFFRPPYGEFSPFSLYITQQLGWKTVFWSIAYVDWVTTNQPGREYVISHFQTNIHYGAIPLLHTVSQSNAEALPYVIDWLRGEGYVFRSLYDLP